MKYFVTGATGFIGNRVAEMLIASGHKVTALVRSPEKADRIRKMGIEAVYGDIRDRESLLAPMKGADGVFHMAGWYEIGTRDKRGGMQVNVAGTRNVLEAMKILEIPKGVYTSTVAINSDTKGKIIDETAYHPGPHLSEYDKTKWIAHHEVAMPMIREGLPLVIVQPAVVYGPGDTSLMGDTFRQWLLRRLPAIPRKAAYAWAHVDDVARGHLLAMEKGRIGENYFLGGPNHTLIEAFEIAQAVTGIPAPPIHLPPMMLKMTSWLLEPLDPYLPLPPSYTSEALRVTAGATYLNTSGKARRELGYTDRPLAEGMRETLFALMREIHPPPA